MGVDKGLNADSAGSAIVTISGRQAGHAKPGTLLPIIPATISYGSFRGCAGDRHAVSASRPIRRIKQRSHGAQGLL